jgi:hypothetical protein
MKKLLHKEVLIWLLVLKQLLLVKYDYLFFIYIQKLIQLHKKTAGIRFYFHY